MNLGRFYITAAIVVAIIAAVIVLEPAKERITFFFYGIAVGVGIMVFTLLSLYEKAKKKTSKKTEETVVDMEQGEDGRYRVAGNQRGFTTLDVAIVFSIMVLAGFSLWALFDIGYKKGQVQSNEQAITKYLQDEVKLNDFKNHNIITRHGYYIRYFPSPNGREGAFLLFAWPVQEGRTGFHWYHDKNDKLWRVVPMDKTNPLLLSRKTIEALPTQAVGESP